MMTPEQYFDEHPNVAVLAWDGEEMYTERFGYDYRFSRDRDEVYIDWTGYDPGPRCAFNPHFAWGKRREVEWTGEFKAPIEKYKDHEICRELIDPDGKPTGIAQIGRYVDAPAEKPAPDGGKDSEHPCDLINHASRFLPEGWHYTNCIGEIRDKYGMHRLNVGYKPKDWHNLGLLHPSEGGGFQKMTGLEGVPKGFRGTVDTYWKTLDEIKFNHPPFLYNYATAWRPHFGKGGES